MKIGKSLDKVFICVFLLIIFLPNIGLFKKTDNVKIINSQNREPYNFPSINLSKLNDTNFNLIEKWYADKILFIDKFTQYWSKFNYDLNISTKPNQVIIGKNNWMFLGNDFASIIDQYTGKNTPSEDEMLLMVKNFKQMNLIAKQNNIPFIVVIAPEKQDIYPEFLPDYIKKSNNPSRLDILNEKLLTEGISTINLKTALIKSKATMSLKYGPLYYKGDTHWNLLGAYVSFLAIESMLKTQPIPEIIFENKSSSKGDLYKFLGIKGLISDSDIIPILNKYDQRSTYYESEGKLIQLENYFYGVGPVIYNKPVSVVNNLAPSNETALLIGDSFTDYGCSHNIAIGYSPDCLGLYFKLKYKYTVRIHNGNTNYSLVKLIRTYHPKVIIFEIVERSLLNYSNNFQQEVVPDKAPISTSVNLNGNIDSIESKGEFIEISGWGYIPKKDATLSKIYLRLYNKDNSFDYLLNTAYRPDITNAFHNDGLHLGLSGVYGKIKSLEIPTGKYKASIIIKNGNEIAKKDFDTEYKL